MKIGIIIVGIILIIGICFCEKYPKNKLFIILSITSIGIFFIFPLFIDQFIMNKFETNWEMQTWAGFLGSYLGGAISALITLGGVWWQVRRTEKKENEEKRMGVLRGILYSLDKNLIFDEKYSDEENKKKLEIILLSNHYIFNYYENYTVMSEFYNSVFYEIIPEIIKENYKIIFELECGKEIINLIEDIKFFNKNHKFLSVNSQLRKKILTKIEVESKKIKMEVDIENEEIQNLKRLGTDYEKILEIIKKTKEISIIFSSIKEMKRFDNEELLEKARENTKYLNLLWSELVLCEDEVLKEDIDKLGKILLAEEVVLSEKCNIFKIMNRIEEVKKSILEEVERF